MLLSVADPIKLMVVKYCVNSWSPFRGYDNTSSVPPVDEIPKLSAKWQNGNKSKRGLHGNGYKKGG